MAQEDDAKASDSRWTADRRRLAQILGSGPAVLAVLNGFDALKPFGDQLTRLVRGFDRVSSTIWGWVDLHLPFSIPASHSDLTLLCLIALPSLRTTLFKQARPSSLSPTLTVLNIGAMLLLFMVFSFTTLWALTAIVVAFGLFLLILRALTGPMIRYRLEQRKPSYLRRTSNGDVLAVIGALALLVMIPIAAIATLYVMAPKIGDVAVAACIVILFFRYLRNDDLAPSYMVCGALGIWAIDYAGRLGPSLEALLDAAGA